jgi:hypothetical protein
MVRRNSPMLQCADRLLRTEEETGESDFAKKNSPSGHGYYVDGVCHVKQAPTWSQCL